MRTLIIDDDVISNNRLDKALKKQGYTCDIVESLKDGKYYLDIRHYDLVLISETLADRNIFEVVEQIKKDTPKTVIMVISTREDNKNEIEALLTGADDFISKPFNLDVLIAHIQASLGFNDNKSIKIEGLTINPKQEKITYQERELELPGKPFEVLTFLAQHRDQILSKEQILEALWIDPEFVTPQVIDVAIQQIRQKIDKRFGITTIETTRCRGYRFIFPKKIK